MHETGYPIPGVSPPGYYPTSPRRVRWWDGNHWLGQEHQTEVDPNPRAPMYFKLNSRMSGAGLMALGLTITVGALGMNLLSYVQAEPGEWQFSYVGAVGMGLALTLRGFLKDWDVRSSPQPPSAPADGPPPSSSPEGGEGLVDHPGRPEQTLEERQRVLPEAVSLLEEVHPGAEDPDPVEGAAAGGPGVVGHEHRLTQGPGSREQPTPGSRSDGPRDR